MVVLVELPAWAIAVVCLGIALILERAVFALLGWLLQWLNRIPYVELNADVFKPVEQSVSHALGVAFGWVDSTLGASFHALARMCDWLWREISDAARGYALLVELVAKLVYAHSGLRTLVHDGSRLGHFIVNQVHTLEREWHGIEHRVRTIERAITQGIGHDLRIGLQATEKELARVESDVIPSIQAAEQDAANAISDLYEWAKGKASLLGIGTFAVAVAAALDVLGLKWIRCKEGQSLFNRRGCGMWNDLEGLLGLLTDLFLFTEICDVLPLLDTAVSDIALPLVVGLTDVGAGLCAADSSAPAALTGPPIDPPPVYFTGSLILA